MQENKKEESEIARLLDVPGIAAQKGWKAWKATFADVSVYYARTNPSVGFTYVATGTNKKEAGTFHTPFRDMKYLYKNLVELYGREDAADSSEWAVIEIPIFLN